MKTEMNHLTKEDYQKSLEICFLIHQYADSYPRQVLKILSGILGSRFANLTFLTADNRNKLGNPVGINKVRSLCGRYAAGFDRFDIFNADRHTKQPAVMSITDIMSYPDYEGTVYYYDLLRTEDLYYELAVPLYVNHKLVGGIGIFREKKEGDFTTRDKELMTLLSRHLALGYVNSLKLGKRNTLRGQFEKNDQHEDLLSRLTSAEREIISLVEKGMTNREMARQKKISVHTINSHLEHIYNKLEVHSRTEMLYRIYRTRPRSGVAEDAKENPQKTFTKKSSWDQNGE
ncbi:hypothetical protein J9303_15250 [Bacillaceae bacterium Marseille-Q3522]|nr:hypothetical protein [Bacillaceae bacterium Marseille-Q3522]